MATPPLLLERSLVSRLLVEANSAFRPGGEPLSHCRTHVTVARRQEHADRWQVSLDVTVEPDADRPGPYSAELSMHGFFHLPGELPEEETTNLLAITGASILYSAAREHLLLVTGRGPWGPMQLPTNRFAPLHHGSQPAGESSPAPAESTKVLRRPTAKLGGRRKRVP